ncbi:uncharacterized protein A4U43_C05F33910 [Asparagus officinalis]|uniref:Cytosolic endo-beta-N-acetylglucosaminidase C-terminal domain-containing protein n=1 Tax=Asparagus officinalis TaxID=4686 RepID=A0A5P1EWN6_ASPOF|nr:uncharacterized protein A4U43_C05F33910 [Asparagus officinalis]
MPLKTLCCRVSIFIVLVVDRRRLSGRSPSSGNTGDRIAFLVVRPSPASGFLIEMSSIFHVGHGLQFSIKGLQVAENPWNNISCQGIQPLLEEPVLLPDKPGDSKRANIQVFINFDQSYNGGGNITCKGNLGGNEFFTTRIFQGQLPLRDLPVTFTYSVKSNDGTKKATLTLIWELKEENAKSVFTKYNIYVQKLDDQDGKKKFLRVARVERFYVSDLEVPIGGIGVKFVVQPCGPDGACQEVVDQRPAQVLAQ